MTNVSGVTVVPVVLGVVCQQFSFEHDAPFQATTSTCSLLIWLPTALRWQSPHGVRWRHPTAQGWPYHRLLDTQIGWYLSGPRVDTP
eukprot:2092342-Amphidinium_carterae.1